MSRVKIILLASLSLLAVSCAKTMIDTEETSVVYSMKFEGRVDDFDGGVLKSSQPSTRLTDSGVWENGDKLYLIFNSGNKTVPAEALYNSDSNLWSINIFGSLTACENLPCSVYFFLNPAPTDNYSTAILNLNGNTAIYDDEKASYSLNSNNELVIKATLSPKTSRIRFKGIKNQQMKVVGLTTYGRFDTTTGKFYKGKVSGAYLQFADDGKSTSDFGYTSYLYGEFEGEINRLYIITQNGPYTRFCEDKILAKGKSGYLDVPYGNVNNSWALGFYFTVNGVDFTMLQCPGYGKGTLLSTTEVTEELYYTINGSSSTSQLPITNITRSEAIAFCDELSQITNFRFKLPEVWHFEHAINNITLNSIDEYAWYQANSSEAQTVKQKLPNNFGLYDLCGNVAEWTNTLDNDYSLGYEVIYYRYMGGSYLTPKEEFDKDRHIYQKTKDKDYKAEDLGFRLCIDESF